MEPWQSWALVGAVGVGAAYYYSTTGPKRRARGRGAPVPEQTQHRNAKIRNESKDKRRKEKDSGASDQVASDAGDGPVPAVPANKNENINKRKAGKKNQSSKLAQSAAVETSKEQTPEAGDGHGEDEGMSNVEFAKQLSSMKTGTSLKKPDNTTQTKKTRKQGKRNEALPETANGSANKAGGGAKPHDLSTTSSTTGADADDDLSSINSPELGATQTTNTTPSARDVSDMLETPAKGPSVLRLTEPANTAPSRQPKQQKVAPEPETKKQRQHRQKNEEKKALREQAEKERRVLLEKQLRTAREAEGRPAKNGLGPSPGPSSSAWSKSANAQTRSTAVPPNLSQGPLLDTFDDTTSATSANGKANHDAVDHRASKHDLPSEEEQMRILSEMDSDNSWSTVPKGGKAKKKTPAPPSDSGGDILAGGREKNDVSNGTKSVVANNVSEKKTSTAVTAGGTNGTITQSSAKEEGPGGQKARPLKETKPVKATKETIDHSVWNRSNIHEHPDYDSDYPYALTGHPEDSDWAVA